MRFLIEYMLQDRRAIKGLSRQDGTCLDTEGYDFICVTDKIKTCCPKMNEVWNDVIAWGKDETVEGKVPFISIVETNVGYGDDVSHEYHKIDFCPFCGTQIAFYKTKEVKIVKRSKKIKIPESEEEELTLEEEPI